MIIKKHIIHNFTFYIHNKINIQKTHEMKKILNIRGGPLWGQGGALAPLRF